PRPPHSAVSCSKTGRGRRSVVSAAPSYGPRIIKAGRSCETARLFLCLFYLHLSPLINRQRPVLQLQDRQVDRRGEDGADVPRIPAAVAALRLDEVFEHRLLVL